VRQVLILLSDGNDTISGSSLRRARCGDWYRGFALYHQPEQNGSRRQGEPRTPGTGRGYRRQKLSAQDDAAEVLEPALADLRASYVVTYPLPSRMAGFHSLRILPKHNLNLRFHCRRGYFYDEVR
jgi:hypothetical protein